MNKRIPRPYNVSNPASRTHVADLCPNQQLRVMFSDVAITDECKAVVESDLLELSNETYDSRGKTFVFDQKYDLSRWAAVSSVYLGHISFSGMGRVNPSVGVYLRSTTPCKRDVVTTVNPSQHIIKIYPQQILEVVTYVPLWGQDVQWEYEEGDNALEMLYGRFIDPSSYALSNSFRDTNDAFFVYPRALAASARSYLEYHWWFRYRQLSAKLAKTFGSLAVPMSFVGRENGVDRIRYSFTVMINERAEDGWESLRSAQVTSTDSALDVGDSVPATLHPFILPDLRADMPAYHNHGGRCGRKERRKQKAWLVQNRNGGKARQHPTSYTRPFEVRDVAIRIKPGGSLDSGCRVFPDDSVTTLPQLPAPASHSSNASLGYRQRGQSEFRPNKAIYYYEPNKDQWE